MRLPALRPFSGGSNVQSRTIRRPNTINDTVNNRFQVYDMLHLSRSFICTNRWLGMRDVPRLHLRAWDARHLLALRAAWNLRTLVEFFHLRSRYALSRVVRRSPLKRVHREIRLIRFFGPTRLGSFLTEPFACEESETNFFAQATPWLAFMWMNLDCCWLANGISSASPSRVRPALRSSAEQNAPHPASP